MVVVSYSYYFARRKWPLPFCPSAVMRAAKLSTTTGENRDLQLPPSALGYENEGAVNVMAHMEKCCYRASTINSKGEEGEVERVEAL